MNHAVLVAKKGNDATNSVTDLSSKSFAFDSKKSTHSGYLPAKMMMDVGVLDSISSSIYVGKHGVVVNAVSEISFRLNLQISRYRVI